VAGLQYLIFGLLLICVVLVQANEHGSLMLARVKSLGRVRRATPELTPS
jgi:hypothetical protein